jgi:hypothetical protein
VLFILVLIIQLSELLQRQRTPHVQDLPHKLGCLPLDQALLPVPSRIPLPEMPSLLADFLYQRIGDLPRIRQQVTQHSERVDKE